MLKVNEIIKLLDCKVFTNNKIDELKEIEFAFSADLMSDTLYMLNKIDDFEVANRTVLITGLATNQTVKSAEILDIDVVIIVRGKIPNDAVIKQANDANIVLLGSKYTMFSSSGILYQNKIKGIASND